MLRHFRPLLFLLITCTLTPVAHGNTGTATVRQTTKIATDDASEHSTGDCTENYYQGSAPNFINPALARNSVALCFDGFTVMYSGISRTALWSAEYVTRDRIEHAETLERRNNFHEEQQLPAEIRATLGDYKGSGFDRGHMSPNGDMDTLEQQYDSFSLANIVPQNSYNNREPWRLLEDATRELVKQEGSAYIITGAAFRGSTLRKIGNVLIPSDLYKVVYFPNRQVAGVYFAPNDASGQIRVISLAQLDTQIGLDLLPLLPDRVKQHRINMPLAGRDAIRPGYFSGREVRVKIVEIPNTDHRPINYGIFSDSQLAPARRGLFVRMWQALWQNE